MGWSQRQLATYCGWSTKFVCQLLLGKTTVSPGVALQLEAVTGISAKSLLMLEADCRLAELKCRGNFRT
jgi:plasmid maintenance system antidote protein VapI